MKNVFLHYVALMVPFALIMLNMKEQLVELPAWLSVMTFMAWSIWYAPYLNGRRLFVKGITEKQGLAYHTTFARFKAIYLSK
ncbi:MAG: hypothetical protein ACRDCN_10870 [Tannerellaceae bacterium]